MPLTGSGTVLSTAIKAQMVANGIVIASDADLTKLTKAIADAVVAHIVANAVVNVTSVSGVTAGGAVSGPGTGTIA